MMTTSATSARILGVLFRLQKTLPAVQKTGVDVDNGRHFATLTSVLDAIMAHLTKARVLVTHAPHCTDQGHGISTRLTHITSGEWVEVTCIFLPTAPGTTSAQIATAHTFGRRYNLQAVLNLTLADEEDATGKAPCTPSAHAKAMTDEANRRSLATAGTADHVVKPVEEAATAAEPAAQPIETAPVPVTMPATPAMVHEVQTLKVRMIAKHGEQIVSDTWTRCLGDTLPTMASRNSLIGLRAALEGLDRTPATQIAPAA